MTETRDDDNDDKPDHVIRTDAGTNIGTIGGSAEQFYLKELPGLSMLDWTRALSQNGYTVPYNMYGHATGNIRVKVEAVVGSTANLSDDPHVANTIGEPAEQYKLTVTYEPNDETIPYAQSHITENGDKGTAIDDTSYLNTHY